MRFTKFIMAATLLASCAGRVSAETAINGTGAAFAAPIYIAWSHEAKAPTGVAVNYQATGSGVGQTQIVAGTVDFGASDAPMDASKIEAANLRQIPTVVGGLDVIVNLPDLQPNVLRLTGPVLAAIYMGEVTRWSDPRLVKLNPDLSLPDIDIVPMHHATASGSTFALSRYLSKVSPDWKARMGAGMTLEWPGGVGVHGSAGATGGVALTKGSIAYAESSYVSKNKLTSVLLLNRAGNYVAPNGDTFAAAAAAGDWGTARNFAIDLTDMPGERSWPIVTATFVLVPKDPAKAAKSGEIRKFFAWAYDHGDALATSLDYVPLPVAVKQAVLASWAMQ